MNSFLSLLFFLFAIAAGEDIASDRVALLALRSAVGGRSLLWNLTHTTPCSWSGVFCKGNRVTMLRFPGVGFSGTLPLGLGNLTQLKTLSLRFNALNGTIPSDFANLVNLRNLYLHDNFFSGEIPDFVFNLKNLMTLNLGSNNFSGEISPKFNNLTRLSMLFLENNHFIGSIPDINVPPLQHFNVSNNLLNGSIPERFSRLDKSAFSRNSLCGKPLQPCPGTEGGKKKLSGGAIAGIVIGSLFGVLLVLLILLLLCRKKRGISDSNDVAPTKPVEVVAPLEKSGNDSENDASDSNLAVAATKVDGKSLVFYGNMSKPFDLEELLRASAEMLGKGTFGTTYKATVDTGMNVVVKRLRDVTAPENEFKEKIEQVGKMAHENLVPLKGYYFSWDEKLFVYDYMPMGSLFTLLHANSGAGRIPLNWETRSAIALGAARGIAYLHSHGPAFAHGNIKSSNILLTESCEAHVSDFGLAYLALPTSTPNHVEEEMLKVLQLALECTAQYPDKRPSMDVVARRIEEICNSSIEKEGVSQQYYSVDLDALQA
ncbi:PREDICTED: probable inactive receptor kinase RLK902 isoform X2 [Lupinus angustifolius]|uniref:probable inactive receptor kinase RLK902 isoform X2 n=1 Tax=Lupinus angustifolius TaxID=3871 RepID=UPI00092F9DBE|nr:PREDICTED: probable inactive receptor kinase RLK902 isoform X2 [Lupinus angustifolius]